MADQDDELGTFAEVDFWQDARLLWDFRRKGAFVDVYLVCDKKRLPAHRLVLASSSLFFDRILAEDMRSPTRSLEVENITLEVMEMLLEYMYLGQVDPVKITGYCDAVDLVMAAHFLEVEDGSQYFCDILLARWFNEGLGPLWNWADLDGAELVERNILVYLTLHLDKVNKQVAFSELTLQRMRKIMVMASMSDVDYNEQMVRAIAAWVKFKSNEREEHTSKLMQHVKLAYVAKCKLPGGATSDTEPSFLQYVSSDSSTVVIPSMLTGSQSPKRRSKKTASEAGFRLRTPAPATGHEPKRVPSPPVIQVSTGVKKVGRRALQAPTVLRSMLINAKRQPIPFQEAFATFDNSKLLIVCKTQDDRLKLYCVQALTAWWSLPYDLNIMAKGKPTMVVYKQNRIYVFGCSETDPKKTRSENTFIFDAKSMTLRQGLSLRWPRTHMAAAVYQDLIYLIGGLNRFGKVADNVETYNAHHEQVENVARLLERRYEASCVLSNGRLYVLGGHTNRCEAYDCRKEGGSVWTVIEPLPEFLNQVAPVVCAIEGIVYAFPRERATKLLSYICKRNAWRTTQTKHTSPFDLLDCAAVANKIFVLDKSGKLHLYDIKLGGWDEVYSKVEVERPLGLLSVNPPI